MQERTMIRSAEPVSKTVRSAIPAGVSAALLYLALWGCLSNMCGISTLGVLPLSAGLAALLTVLLLRNQKKRRIAAILLLCAAAMLTLIRLPDVLDGGKRLLNRLFQASAARHPYLYDSFSVTGVGTGGISWLLAPAGMLAGLWIGWTAAAERRILQAVPAVVLLGAIAWLGVSPEPGWLILLAAALVILRLGTGLNWTVVILLAAVCMGALAVLAFLPARSAALSEWEERARDRLALRTVYYGEDAEERSEEERKDPDGTGGKKRFHRLDETDAGEDGELAWKRPLTIFLLSLLILLMLFGPAFWSDRLKRRRTQNRAGLGDPDARIDICASFLYGLRWLREADLIPGNLPFSAYIPVLSELQPEIGQACAKTVPIWQEAAYSSHSMTEEQRELVRTFLEQAKRLAADRMTWRQKFRTTYWKAL